VKIRRLAARPGPDEEGPIGEEERSSIAAQVARLSVPGKMELAVKGTGSPTDPVAGREQHGGPRGDREPETDGGRYRLLRCFLPDHEDVLRFIADSRQWTANRQVVNRWS